ncbi:MAG: hypothetical protein F6K00_09710 [Leptolyngbya sp. SIOISBB]|nr:hypothetical protein [Leptolyngbya sp. SIOISBB]
MMKRSLLSSCAAILLGAAPALAQEKVTGVKADPPVGGEVIFRLGAAADDTETPRIEHYARLVDRVASPEVHGTDRLAINAAMPLESIRAPTIEGDREEPLAQAEGIDETYPRIGGDVIVRLGYDGAYDAETPRTESHDLFGVMIASPEIHLTDRFAINADIRIETVRPPTADRYFEDHGLFVRSLYAEYAVGDLLSLQAGKFTPTFAFASMVTPGMYGNNYNKEIELIERIGFGAEYTFDTGASGAHTLSANTFFEDTSILSDSLGAQRGQRQLADGGASNTESFESFTVALEGREITWLPSFTYRLAYVHEAAGEGDVADENGLLVAAMQSFQLGDGQSLTLIGEVAPLWNFQGTADNIIYTSAGLVYRAAPWTAILSGTSRWRELATGGTFDDYAVQTSVEYDFGQGRSLAIAHEFSRDRNVNSQRIGFRFNQVLDFD